MTEGVDCINVTHDRDKWQAVVRLVMNLRIHQMHGIAGLADDL